MKSDKPLSLSNGIKGKCFPSFEVIMKCNSRCVFYYFMFLRVKRACMNSEIKLR